VFDKVSHWFGWGSLGNWCAGVGGALIGSYTGQLFNGTTIPAASGYFLMGVLALVCILVAEKGRLFGQGEQYAHGGSEGEVVAVGEH